MLNVYTGKTIEKVSYLEILYYYFGKIDFGVERFGHEAIKLLNKPFFNLVEKPEMADFFLIPHNYFLIKKNEQYLKNFIELSKNNNKKILIVAGGDSDEEIDIPNAIILRTSQYRYKMKNNEIIMPAAVDDLMLGKQMSLKGKTDKPTIGFCGWASFKNGVQKVKEYLKLFVLLIKSFVLFDKNILVRKKGIFWRMEALRILENSNLVNSNFTIRKSFSGNEKTIELDPKIARIEYIKNILDSDISLSIKGDGNFSNRFYEILSLGRVPLFIDTECVLPLEEKIKYNEFILRVSHKDLSHLDRIVSEFYLKLSDGKYAQMQRKAREAFDNYLRIDKFFEYLFNALIKDYI